MSCRIFIAAALALTAPTAMTTSSQELKRRPPEQNARVVVCKALEAHTSKEPAATVVVFHQNDAVDASRLKSLLHRVDEGATVEFQIAGSEEWHHATVARLKSCFGRGLLILPSSAAAPAAGGVFLVRFPASTLKDGE